MRCGTIVSLLIWNNVVWLWAWKWSAMLAHRTGHLRTMGVTNECIRELFESLRVSEAALVCDCQSERILRDQLRTSSKWLFHQELCTNTNLRHVELLGWGHQDSKGNPFLLLLSNYRSRSWKKNTSNHQSVISNHWSECYIRVWLFR